METSTFKTESEKFIKVVLNSNVRIDSIADFTGYLSINLNKSKFGSFNKKQQDAILHWLGVIASRAMIQRLDYLKVHELQDSLIG